MEKFLLTTAILLAGLFVAAVISRIAYAITEKTAQAPLLDIVISLFTWIPWVAGGCMDGWRGVLAAIFAQFLAIQIFSFTDRLIRGKKGDTLTAAQGRLLGPIRNHIALLATTPAAVAFCLIRASEIFVYPLVAWLAKMPTYRQSEWVNLSRHKYAGLVGADLLWCWYCDWMTGLWALGSEMLRNIESFWCPIRFRDDVKNCNTSIDFPDVEKWVPADATLDDAVEAFEKYYDGTGKNSWWGHRDREGK
ncbi:MAG: hypothetical protein ABJQ29_08145 [Luteolibacter sp.]